MAEIVNLRQARKSKARAEKDHRAGENRARFGRTRAQAEHERLVFEMSARGLDAHRRRRPEDED